MNTEQIELLPCPFCRGAAVPSSRFDVICTGCGAEINSQTPEKDWNRRDGIQSAITAATAEVQASRENILNQWTMSEQDLKQAEQERDEAKGRIADLERQLEEVNGQLTNMNWYVNKVAEISAQNGSLRDEAETIRRERDQLRAANGEQAKEIERLRADLAAARERIDVLESGIKEAIGCFDAAEAEGLIDVLMQKDGDRMMDLFERRIGFAYCNLTAALQRKSETAKGGE